MKKEMNIIGLLLLFSIATFAQKDKQARDVLDKTASAFNRGGGIKAAFNLTGSTKNGVQNVSSKGNIRLKGNSFLLETKEAVTWFDGKTQWSYLLSSDEVNISTPTSEELQKINPYYLFNMYRHGFNYIYNGVKNRNGKQGYEVILFPEDTKQDLTNIILFVNKEYQPLYIRLEQKDQSKSEIVITEYQTGQKYPDKLFRFDREKYPNAEIIDLR